MRDHVDLCSVRHQNGIFLVGLLRWKDEWFSNFFIKEAVCLSFHLAGEKTCSPRELPQHFCIFCLTKEKRFSISKYDWQTYFIIPRNYKVISVFSTWFIARGKANQLNISHLYSKVPYLQAVNNKQVAKIFSWFLSVHLLKKNFSICVCSIWLLL